MPPRDKVADIKAAQDLLNRGVTGIDFVKGLAKEGHPDVAQSILNLLKQKSPAITYKHRPSLTVISMLSPRLTIEMTIKVLAQVIVWKVKIGNALKIFQTPLIHGYIRRCHDG